MSMASEDLADRIRALLLPEEIVREQKMFGAIAFMLHGNMLVAPMKDGALLVRVGKDGMDDALALPGASVMTMGSKSMSGFIMVSGDAVEDDTALGEWIDRARTFVRTLPAK
ncbi:TfoX/Sxy family protein [Devosia sp. XJ19-1]|uniref:TfoX/Sxy family protein n=1 Tax=Devosia ureilytica TaxID=2952754 RepID=A0A9Q4FS98_9HYPH|nr:TfoX/Sxy family protein [Devosia ureilytica]MCP8883484.1 TfoX/Sxy family protein [Devosia ureilytica]MCP8887092.1 TfoX/Sxy family protein [Devosia ureilytica]